MDGKIVGWLGRHKLKTIGQKVWALAEHRLTQVKFFLEAGYVGEADRGVETVVKSIVVVGGGVDGFTAWFTAHKLTTMLFAKIHNATSDGDEDQNRDEEAENF